MFAPLLPMTTAARCLLLSSRLQQSLFLRNDTADRPRKEDFQLRAAFQATVHL